MATGFSWEPIEDLPVGWTHLACTEVETLRQIWSEVKTDLDDRSLQTFNRKLANEWAIETGIIEGLYAIDRGTTNTLIEVGLEAASLPHAEGPIDANTFSLLRDQLGALDLVFDVVSDGRDLTLGFIKELHALLTRHQKTTTAVDQFGNYREVELRCGDWKAQSNNPERRDGLMHEYCPVEQVQPQMERLVELHREHVAALVPPEIEAAWLHHRFTQIHPFQDGNGRVARCLASLVLIKGGLFPLVVDRDSRSGYIDALEQADSGNLAALVDTISALERARLRRAIAIADGVYRETTRLDEIIDAFGNLSSPPNTAFQRGFELADRIHERLDSILASIRTQLVEVGGPEIQVVADSSLGQPDKRWMNLYQKIQVARNLEFSAEFRRHDEWSSLRLTRESRKFEVLTMISAVGPTFKGICAVGIAVYETVSDGDGETRFFDLAVTGSEPFLVNYLDDDSAVAHFETWAQSQLATALAMVRRRIG